MWFTSSYSNGAGGECVECAATSEGTLIRDSKNVRGPVVSVPLRAWRRFVDALSRGDLT
ncbi:DUF397 domain-containing protein [Streptomyces hygroscopicus]|uniref:DUF397 domain-containing protein n=1 Tax=Streptomyces hygroscopicus TaxID=1912 RepID=UPI00223FD1A8|nr:DUF397 domain-containing protein [Streptomyces hygroscopicus]